MHISIGAAILILGLLFLATSKAGLKVLGAVLVLLIVVGVFGGVYLHGVFQREEAAHAADDANWQAHLPELRAQCEKMYPVDPSEAPTSFKNWGVISKRSDCERRPWRP
jgi:hypothetical protein